MENNDGTRNNHSPPPSHLQHSSPSDSQSPTLPSSYWQTLPPPYWQTPPSYSQPQNNDDITRNNQPSQLYSQTPPPSDLQSPTLPPYYSQSPTLPPSDSQSPTLPSYYQQSPILPPYDSQSPILPPSYWQSPTLPPYDSQSPTLPPYDSQSPILPPYDSQSPILPPYDSQSPILPPYDSQSPTLPSYYSQSQTLPSCYWQSPTLPPPYDSQSPTLPPYDSQSPTLPSCNSQTPPPPNSQLPDTTWFNPVMYQENPQLRDFWINEMATVEDLKAHQLPLNRIRKIMKSDDDEKMLIAAEAPYFLAKSCEIFIHDLMMRSWIHAEENKRCMLLKSDIISAVTCNFAFDFLVDIVPRDESFNADRAAMARIVAPNSEIDESGMDVEQEFPEVSPAETGDGEEEEVGNSGEQ